MELTVDIRRNLSGFSLAVAFSAEGRPVSMLGASGSGKSMTLRCIAGLEKPDAGRITLGGRVLFDSERGVNVPSRDRKIGFLFQNYALFPNMTVADNIAFSLGGLGAAERRRRVGEQLEAFHLTGLGHRHPRQLSGGQQQRVALARALASEPDALLLDEPFSALDDHLRWRMVSQMRDMTAGFSGAFVLVSHSVEEAWQLGERMVVLEGGRMEAAGAKESLFASPPSSRVARLTGCRNLAEAEEPGCADGGEVGNVGEELDACGTARVRVPAWGTELTGFRTVPGRAGAVGIRAHFIRLARPDETVNCLPAEPVHVSEMPFRVLLHLRIPGAPACQEEGCHLLWEMTREGWESLRNMPRPWRICLPPENVMLMRE